MVKQSAKKYRITNSKSDKIFDAVNIVIMILLLFIFVWPLWFVVISSFSNPYEVWKGNVLIWFKGFTLKGYEQLFNYEPIWIGYRNSLLYTVLGSVINMVMTVLCAYPLSRKDWLPRNFFMKFCLVTMYFGGGLIPTYLVVRNLRMTNTIWAMMIPCAMSFYNALIVRSYFSNSIPHELQEAAELDGANPMQYLIKVVLPLSKPVLAVVWLYYAVGHWNDYYTALVYISDRELIPLQTALREVLMSASSIADMLHNGSSDLAMKMQEKQELAMSLKYTSIIAGIHSHDDRLSLRSEVLCPRRDGRRNQGLIRLRFRKEALQHGIRQTELFRARPALRHLSDLPSGHCRQREEYGCAAGRGLCRSGGQSALYRRFSAQ